jgi:hypothetical protein
MADDDDKSQNSFITKILMPLFMLLFWPVIIAGSLAMAALGAAIYIIGILAVMLVLGVLIFGAQYLFETFPGLSFTGLFTITAISCVLVAAVAFYIRRYAWGLSRKERNDLAAADWTSTWISLRKKRIICYATHSPEYLNLLISNPLLALKLAGVPTIFKNVHVGIKIDGSFPSVPPNANPTYDLWVYVRRTDARSVAALRATRQFPAGKHCALSIDTSLPDNVIPKEIQNELSFSIETMFDDPEQQSLTDNDLYLMNKKLDQIYNDNCYEPWIIKPKSLFTKYHWLIAGLISAALTSVIFYTSNESSTYQTLRLTEETYKDLCLSWSHLFAAIISLPIVSLVANFMENSKFNEVFHVNLDRLFESSISSIASSFGFLFVFSLFL